MAEGGGGRAKVRLVRCSRCDDLLPEHAYRCGACNASLRAKRDPSTTDSSSERFYGEKATYFYNSNGSSKNKGVGSETGSETDTRSIGFDLREEAERLGLSPAAIPGRSPTSGIADRVNRRPPARAMYDGVGRYHQPSKTRISDSSSSEDDMVKEGSEAKRGAKIDGDRVPAFCRVSADQGKATSSPNYPEEGSSNLCRGFYSDGHSKKQNQSRIDEVEYVSQDPLQLLRQLDELRYRISRSCEVAEKTRVGIAVTEKPVSERQRERMPVTEVYSTGMPNLYSPLHDNHGYNKVHEPQALGQTPHLSPSQYPERSRNEYLRRQFDADPLVSYHHDEFNHQPSCSCTRCYHKHRPLTEWVIPHSVSSQSQRHHYLAQNHGSYPVSLQMLRMPEDNQRAALATISKKKDKLPCQTFAGAAPFVICSSCFELLRLPQITLLVPKKLCKLRCGSCSEVLSLELIGKRLVTSATQLSIALAEARGSSHVEVNQHMQSKVHISRKLDTSYTEEYSGPCKINQSTDDNIFSPPISSHELVERECMLNSSESDKMKGLSMSFNMSDNVESQDNMIGQRATSTKTELLFDAEVISGVSDSPIQDHLVCSLSSQVMDVAEKGSMNVCSDQQTTVSHSEKFQQISAKDEVATEIDLSAHEYPSSSFSRDYQEIEKDESQAKIDTSDGSFVLKESLKDFPLFNHSVRKERSKVSVNGHPILDHLVCKAEKQAGLILPGEYWYDRCAGFWGVMGQPCHGIIPPFIEEFNYPMSKNCAGGNTGVLVNGRELHQKDLDLLVGRGLPPTAGRSYVLEFSGNVFDEVSGEELGNLGKLAPTVAKRRCGFGMRVPS